MKLSVYSLHVNNKNNQRQIPKSINSCPVYSYNIFSST